MRNARALVPAAAVAVLAVAAGVGASGVGASGVASATPVRLDGSERRLIRDATEQFRDVDTALAAGYVPVGGCVELPGVGGMGLHYLNPALAGDAVVDPAQPELLVYNAGRDGDLHLSAVEYFVADADQDLATDGDRPSLFDEYAFEGPMPGHEPGMPVHYDLHVWLYEANPAGELAVWNPRAHC